MIAVGEKELYFRIFDACVCELSCLPKLGFMERS